MGTEPWKLLTFKEWVEGERENWSEICESQETKHFKENEINS